MTTMNDEHGCSTCKAPGTEKYEAFPATIRRKKVWMYQYDYRHTDGELFSTVAPSLDICRQRRNVWLTNKKGGQA